MKAFLVNLGSWSGTRSGPMLFVLFSAAVAVLAVSLASTIGVSRQARDAEHQQLTRQYEQVQKAAVLVRDLALAEDRRSALREELASVAAVLATESGDPDLDLSLISQLRVFVARLRSLSQGGDAPLLASDPRFRGVVEATQGALGQGLKQRLEIKEKALSAGAAASHKQLVLLVLLSLVAVVVFGAVLLARRMPSADWSGQPSREDFPGDGMDQVDNAALSTALEGLDQGVALFDAGDSLVFFTPQLQQMYAGVLEPVEGQSYERFVRDILTATEDGTPDQPTGLDEQLSQRLTQPHGNLNLDFLPDGRCLEIGEYGTSGGGRIVLVRDVTETEHREAVRKLTDARTTAIVDTVFDGIIMINDEGLIETFNPAAEAIFGYAAAEVIGKNVIVLMPERHASAHDGYLARYLDGGAPKVVGAITELQGQRKDGQLFPLEIAVNEVDATWILQERRRTPRRVFIATLRDITEQKELARQLQQSQKMEAIGTLAGGIAHDFNNILSVILGFTGLTLEDGQINEEGRENLDTVLEAANRARDLVQQILTFSRKGDQEKLRVDLQTVLADALKMLRSTLPANVEMRADIDPRELEVMADPTQMHQILMNLCTNAGQAMPGGGILEIKAQHVRIDGKTLDTLDMQGSGNCIRLMVRDTGIGMDAATLDRVFEPFYTTKPLGAGTGLGLSVVHGIIHEHGGHISVESAPGAGSTFTVLLPLAESGEVVEEKREVPTPSGTGSILFVDDEAAVVRMADRILSRLGYEVIGRSSSVEALKLFREHPDKFDLVVTDHSMPDMTGDVLASELRRIHPDVPIVICTGYSATYTPEVAKEAGINGYILKPALATELGRVVAEVLAESRA